MELEETSSKKDLHRSSRVAYACDLHSRDRDRRILFKNTDTPEGGWVRRQTAQALRETPDPHTDAAAQVVYRGRDL